MKMNEIIFCQYDIWFLIQNGNQCVRCQTWKDHSQYCTWHNLTLTLHGATQKLSQHEQDTVWYGIQLMKIIFVSLLLSMPWQRFPLPWQWHIIGLCSCSCTKITTINSFKNLIGSHPNTHTGPTTDISIFLQCWFSKLTVNSPGNLIYIRWQSVTSKSTVIKLTDSHKCDLNLTKMITIQTQWVVEMFVKKAWTSNQDVPHSASE